MKSIGLSDESYIDLLNVKHNFEKQEGRIISYDEIIKKLIALNGNNYQPNKQLQADREKTKCVRKKEMKNNEGW